MGRWTFDGMLLIANRNQNKKNKKKKKIGWSYKYVWIDLRRSRKSTNALFFFKKKGGGVYKCYNPPGMEYSLYHMACRKSALRYRTGVL